MLLFIQSRKNTYFPCSLERITELTLLKVLQQEQNEHWLSDSWDTPGSFSEFKVSEFNLISDQIPYPTWCLGPCMLCNWVQ